LQQGDRICVALRAEMLHRAVGERRGLARLGDREAARLVAFFVLRAYE
jgi:hypothetical protein